MNAGEKQLFGGSDLRHASRWRRTAPWPLVTDVFAAADRIRQGGVLAYPTEAVYGLGCDPHNSDAVAMLCSLKERSLDQGFLLVAASFEQIERYIDIHRLPGRRLEQIKASWPGPSTWVVPRTADVPEWLVGRREGIALRVTAHAPAAAMCRAFGGALVSTSANPHGAPPARHADQVVRYFGGRIDGVLDAPVGGLLRPTTIRDAMTGAVLRA